MSPKTKKTNFENSMKEFQEATLKFFGNYGKILERMKTIREKQFLLLKETSTKLDQYKLAQTQEKI